MADSGTSQRPLQPTPTANRRWLRIMGVAALVLAIGFGLWWGLSFQPKRAAIQRVMAEWKSIHDECWPQVHNSGTPKTAEATAQQEALFARYYGKAKLIDLSGCPPEFSTAFTNHVDAVERHHRNLYGPLPAKGLDFQHFDDGQAAAEAEFEAYDRLSAIAKKYWIQIK